MSELNRLTWARDGFGRCFVVRIGDFSNILYCAFNASAAMSFIREYEEFQTS